MRVPGGGEEGYPTPPILAEIPRLKLRQITEKACHRSLQLPSRQSPCAAGPLLSKVLEGLALPLVTLSLAGVPLPGTAHSPAFGLCTKQKYFYLSISRRFGGGNLGKK